MADTHGFPLEILLEIAKENNMVVDWIDFWDEAIKAGWKEIKILNKLETCLTDAYSKEYKMNVIYRLIWRSDYVRNKKRLKELD